jgi:hypothetical protein
MPKSQSRSGMSYYSNQIHVIEAHTDLEPEQKLWRAVLNQTFDDAFSPITELKTKEVKKEALDYLRDMEINTSLSAVCEYAGFDVRLC